MMRTRPGEEVSPHYIFYITVAVGDIVADGVIDGVSEVCSTRQMLFTRCQHLDFPENILARRFRCVCPHHSSSLTLTPQTYYILVPVKKGIMPPRRNEIDHCAAVACVSRSESESCVASFFPTDHREFEFCSCRTSAFWQVGKAPLPDKGSPPPLFLQVGIAPLPDKGSPPPSFPAGWKPDPMARNLDA